MNLDEITAKAFLESEGFHECRFEPDGNLPPDFSIDNVIGVEVRRLNQHLDEEPLERDYYRLYDIIESILKEISSNSYDFSFAISYYFSRPLFVDKKVKNEIKRKLEGYLSGPRIEARFVIGDNLELNIYPTGLKLSREFIIGSVSDRDAGGFVVSNLFKNLELVIREKEIKVSPYLNRYSEWWLILVDYISYGLSELEILQLKEVTLIETIFTKVIIIPNNRRDNWFFYKE